jgi:hypothetical protein
MKKCLVPCVGLLLALASASTSWAQIKFDGGGDGTSFLDGLNWSDNLVPNDPNPIASGDPHYAINDNAVVSYATSATTLVEGLLVGADAPQMPGNFGTAGTLNMSDGKLVVTGGGDSFQIGRACCAGTGVINLTGDAVLEIQGSDPAVGTRDRGELNVGPGASVISNRPGGVYWRVGNYGPDIDGGLEGSGLLNVEGSFQAHVIFLGATDGDGELRVSGAGSVVLTDNLVPNVNTDMPNRSALVHMIGSNATLSALNLESANGMTQVHNEFEFSADAGGVSPITLANAANITNNDLVVNMNSFVLGLGATEVLFNAAPNQIYGTFASLAVNGGNPSHQYAVVYDQVAGDILLQRVPEPTTAVLLGLGLVLATCARRRVSQ